MGNSPSKNATSNTSVTSGATTLEAVAEDSGDDSGGRSGYIRAQNNYQQQSHQYYNQHHQQQHGHHHQTKPQYPRRYTKSINLSDGGSKTISIPGTTERTSNSLASSSPITNSSSSLSTPSTVDTMLSSSSGSIDYSEPMTRPRKHPSSPSAMKPSLPKRGLPVDDYIEQLLNTKTNGREFCLETSDVKAICRVASGVFMSQPVFLELGTPVKVVGDVHGQYGDLMRIFQTCGMPPKSNYLFLGDYVDRGKQSLETIMLLLCLKIKHPENVFLLRGNHECASVTKVYGFYDECKRRCNIKTWKSIVDVFNTMPIAATVGGRIFCVHGGLSPSLNNMDEITNIQRPTDVPDSGLISDLLWSDPEETVASWGENDRGVSYCFGKSVVDKFCKKHGFDLVARGHMVVEDGYEFFNNRKLVTVFSAPNYCGEFQNWGAVMSVSKELLCSFDLLKPLDSNNTGVKRAVRVVQEALQ